MGRYSRRSLRSWRTWPVRGGQRAIDVGCGPGALTAELVTRLGPEAVCGRRPVRAVRRRRPGAQSRRRRATGVRRAAARSRTGRSTRPSPSSSSTSCRIPSRGLAEMARVTRQGGCRRRVRLGSRGRPRAAERTSGRRRESWTRTSTTSRSVAGTREGHLAELFEAAGLREIEEAAHSVSLEHPTFDEWWEPFTLGVGPAGSSRGRARRGTAGPSCARRCRSLLPDAAVRGHRAAWAARGLCA